MAVWEIPFAAVTICPIGGPTPQSNDHNLSDTNSVNPLNSFEGSVETRITNAKWRNNYSSSGNLFTEVATEEGFCFTFNMMNFNDLFEDNV